MKNTLPAETQEKIYKLRVLSGQKPPTESYKDQLKD